VADPTVKLFFSGDGRDAERAIASLERKVEGLEQKLKRSSESQKKSASEISSALEGAVGPASLLATAGTAIAAAFRGAVTETLKFSTEVDEILKKTGDAELRLRIQGGFTPAQVESQLPNIKKALFATPSANATEAIQLQTQLAGAGFKQKDIQSGEALAGMLQLKAVTNAFGRDAGDPKETVLGMSQLLKGLGHAEPAAKDIFRVGKQVATLMAESDIQFRDLSQLAGEAATLGQFGMTEQQQLGAYSWMRDVKGPEEGATGLRIFTSRTATAATDKERTKALKSIGLTPADVAISKGGVTFEEAVGKIQKGMAGLPEQQRNNFLTEMYGEKGQTAASIILSQEGAAKISGRIRMAENADKAFQDRLGIFQSSRQAVNLRAANDKDWILRDVANRQQTWGEFDLQEQVRKTKLMSEQTTQGGRLGAGYMNWIEGVADWMHKATGATPEGMMGSQEGSEMKRLAQEQIQAIENQTKVLERIDQKQAKPQINRNAQQE